jgi:hypothetical protein
MLVRTFSADTAEEALERVRQSWGDQAVILSSYESPRGRGAEIRATVEASDLSQEANHTLEPAGILNENLERRLRKELLQPSKTAPSQSERLSQALAAHGLSRALTKKIAGQAEAARIHDDILALGAALDSWGLFDPLSAQSAGPFLLFGLEQECLFETKLALDNFLRLDSRPEQIEVACLASWRADKVVPLATKVKHGHFEPIYVGAIEAKQSELARGLEVLAAMGGHRVILSNVGATEKLGPLLTAGCHPRARLAQVVLSKDNGGRLETLNPLSLARLLLNWQKSL